MRASLNNIRRIEEFITGKLKPSDSLLFRVKLMLEPELRRNVYLQQKTYLLIRLFGRKKVRSEIEEISQHLFNDPDHVIFQNQVKQIFPKS